MTARSQPGTLVTARGREWVVLPDSTDDFLVLRPLGGGDDDVAGVLPGIEEVTAATFPPPTADDLGDQLSAGLLRTALRIGFRSTRRPVPLARRPRRRAARLPVRPAVMALRQDAVRLLIADDVGIGKTIEAGADRRRAARQGDAQRPRRAVQPGAGRAVAGRAAREVRHRRRARAAQHRHAGSSAASSATESIFERYPITVVSTDFIKSARRRHEFLRTCPDLVIVDEAHTCVADRRSGGHGPHPALRAAPQTWPPTRRGTSSWSPPPRTAARRRRSATCSGLLDPDLRDRRPRRASAAGNCSPGTSCSAAAPTSGSYLDEDTPFPQDRETTEVPYALTPEYRRPVRRRSSTTPASRSDDADGGHRASGCAGGRRSRCCARWPRRRGRRADAAHPGRPRLPQTRAEEADAIGRADRARPGRRRGARGRRRDARRGRRATSRPGTGGSGGCASFARPARRRWRASPTTKLAELVDDRQAAARPTASTRSSSAASSTPPTTSPSTSRRRSARTATVRVRHRRRSRRRSAIARIAELGRHDGPPRAGRHRLPVRGRQPAGPLPGRRPLRPGLEPDPPRAARGPRRPVRPDRATSSGPSPSTAATTRSTASCSTCCSASTRRSARRPASPCRCPTAARP